jgi:hypothetical protein
MEAFIVKNCAGASVRIKSASPMYKDLQLATDGQYLFKSPEEYGAYVAGLRPWIQLKKLEIENIMGKAAERAIEKTIENPYGDYNDFDDPDYFQEKIEVKPMEENTVEQEDVKSPIEAAKEELVGLQSILKDTSDLEEKRKIKARINELKNLIKSK